LTTILAAIFVFGILVTIHEFGHFITAKLTGMKVEEFAIGFGPKIYQTKEGDTLYSLRMIPLGGYNKIAGMDPDDEKTSDGFSSKPMLSRMLVIVAGSLMNFILPVFLFFCIFAVNGIDQPTNSNVIGEVIKGKPAAVAGIREGDRIIAINGESVKSFDGLIQTLAKYPKTEVTFEVERNEIKKEIKITPEYNEDLKRPLIGVYPSYEKVSLSVFDSAKLSVVATKNVILNISNGLIKIFTGKAPADVAGPIGVAQMAGEVAERGIMSLLNFVAFLSINLGIMNLLPIPALDGGHLIVLSIEAIRGKPLSSKVMGAIQMVGFAIILAITAIATFLDLTK